MLKNKKKKRRPPKPQLPQATTPQKSPSGPHKTLEEDAEKHAECIYVAKDGLSAWINLATGAKFPRKPLEKLLRKLEVNYGIDENALIEATRIVNFPRRLILARGEEPSPGMPGKGIHSETIPALDEDIIVKVRDDGMEAYALHRPGVLVPTDIARAAVRNAGICYGIDKAAVKRLYEGPPSHSGRSVIARGKAIREGHAPGFHLSQDVANTTMQDAATQNLQRVRAGTILCALGTW